MKTLAKSALCALYKYSGMLRTQEALASRSFLAILLFHRVTDEIPEDGLTVSTRRFARICRMLRRNFNVVPLAEIFRLRQSGQPFPRRTVAVTFDDCYRDNLFAAQVLAEHQLPACFFMPTAFVGTDHVFAWDRGLKRMANLTWDEVRAMANVGHEIGSHTVTHPDMAQVPLEQARHELVESKRVLEEKLGRPVRWFAYPFGGRDNFRAERVPLVEEAGYEGCVSGFGGFLYPDATDPIVPRVTVPEFHSVLNLELHLRGGLEWYYGLRRAAGQLGQATPQPAVWPRSPEARG
jgi:peptidoglycan/xylan/chitin deacetylase (PgdA/CDA1 family)